MPQPDLSSADSTTCVPLRRSRRLVARALVVVGVLTGTFAAAPAAFAATTAQHYYTADQVFSLINHERAAHGLPALHMSKRLTLSAYHHNLVMADQNLMSHQCHGEASLGDRIDRVHYDWSTAGENIGWTSALTLPATLDLERYMYDEKAPDDGHKLNILSHTFHDVGISVITDSTHRKLWLTEDFGRLM